MRNFDDEHADNLERSYEYDFDRVIRIKLMERFRPFIDPAAPALEVGAFEGNMTEMLLAEHSDLHVVEASEELCRKLAVRFSSRLVVHNSRVEDFAPQQQFGTIYLVHTLEHLDNPVVALAGLKTLLRPNGVICLAVPNAEALSRLIAVEMGIVPSPLSVTEGEFQQGHRRTYNRVNLLADIRQADLTVKDEGGVIMKTLSNGQFDMALSTGVVSSDYVDACDRLSSVYPQFSSSLFAIISAKPE